MNLFGRHLKTAKHIAKHPKVYDDGLVKDAKKLLEIYKKRSKNN